MRPVQKIGRSRALANVCIGGKEDFGERSQAPAKLSGNLVSAKLLKVHGKGHFHLATYCLSK